MHVQLLWNGRLSQMMRKLCELLQQSVPEERPCLGAILGLKCRDTNETVCDGTAPDACLYKSRCKANLRELLQSSTPEECPARVSAPRKPEEKCEVTTRA